MNSNGTRVSLQTDATATAAGGIAPRLKTVELDAPWLWANDPRHIHGTSGQRLRSPATYFSSRARIQSVEIVSVDNEDDDDENDNDNDSGGGGRGTSLFLPPPRGSLHPVGGIYDARDPVAPNDDGAAVKGRRVLRLFWRTDDGVNESSYDLDWLLGCLYSSAKLEKRRRETAVSKEHALLAGDMLFAVQYKMMSTSDNDGPRRHLLQAVFDKGAALVLNAPIARDVDTDAAVAVVGRMLAGGRLSHGHLYGDVFDVKAERDANNVAYTSVALCPHQDLAYYESPPGLQLLHCVENSPGVIGGESVLIDALAAANEFRSLAPHLFDILVRCDVTFVKQREGADMVYRRPHIRLSASGQDVVSVHWSPPFEGPLLIAPELVQDYYVAYSAFARILDNSLPRLAIADTSSRNRLLPMISHSLEADLADYAHAHTWEQRLVPGEMLVFNNQRMLHGRRAFSVNSSAGRERRHLMGCYTSMDDTLSEYRLLRRQLLEAPPYIRNVGNGSISMD